MEEHVSNRKDWEFQELDWQRGGQDLTFPESGPQKKIPNAIDDNLYLYRTIYFVEINIDQNLISNFSWSKIGYQEEPMTVEIEITCKTSFNNITSRHEQWIL